MKENEIRKREVFNKYIELSAKDIETFFKDRSKFVETACPACDSTNFKEVIQKEGFSYHQCINCNTIFVNPRPDIDSLNRYYTDSPSTSYWVNEFFMPMIEVRREKIFKPRAEFIAEYFDEKTGIDIADIGAGFGLFIDELKKLKPDYNIIAIEPSEEMVKICREKGHHVIPMSMEDVDTNKYAFDVLTSFELFEHLHNPGFFLEKAFNLLKPGGYLILTTLNGLGFDIQILWDKAKGVSPPHHLNFFNPWSMELLFKKKGFEIVQIATPGNLDWDIVENMYLNEHVNIGRFWETVSRYATVEAKEKLQKWISDNLLSSHMRIIARKPE